MKPMELKVTRIGNSRGIRLPAATLKRYQVGETVVMEERSDGILLRPVGNAVRKLSWAETASAIAAADENWAEWDETVSDGLNTVPWVPTPSRRVAEPAQTYEASRHRKKER